jgi:hypothetical protein
MLPMNSNLTIGRAQKGRAGVSVDVTDAGKVQLPG